MKTNPTKLFNELTNLEIKMQCHCYNQVSNEVLHEIRKQGENQCYYAIFEGLRKAYEGDW